MSTFIYQMEFNVSLLRNLLLNVCDAVLALCCAHGFVFLFPLFFLTLPISAVNYIMRRNAGKTGGADLSFVEIQSASSLLPVHKLKSLCLCIITFLPFICSWTYKSWDWFALCKRLLILLYGDPCRVKGACLFVPCFLLYCG